MRGLVEVHGIVNGSIEPITKRVNNQEEAEPPVSLSTNSPVLDFKSRATEENADIGDESDNDTIETPSLVPTGLLVSTKSGSRSNSVAASEQRDLTTTKLDKHRRRSAVTKGSTSKPTSVTGSEENAAELTAIQSLVRESPLPTVHVANSENSRSDVINRSPATPKLPRVATLLSVAQKILTVRKRGRTVTNPSLSKAFVFSYFKRVRKT